MLGDGTAITADVLVEGVHFDARLGPADVGYKAVAVSVSDLAAMGARPVWAVLTLSVAAPTDRWVEAFGAGVGEACRAFGVGLIGGDTTGSPGPTVVGVTMGGPCVANPLTRAGGSVGDALWVTGIPGLAGAGWMTQDPGPEALRALRRPTPPLDFALALAELGLCTAAMDLSDGLASDLPRLARASGTGALLDPDALPAHPELDSLPEPLARRCRLCGGDDYQLLLAASPAATPALVGLARDCGVHLTRVGSLTAEPSVRLRIGDWPEGSHVHFRELP